jgi:ABC-type spermidine/putrescine transport system permease subunit I
VVDDQGVADRRRRHSDHQLSAAFAIARNETWWAQAFLGVVIASSTMSLGDPCARWIGLLDTKASLNTVLLAMGLSDRPLRLLGTHTPGRHRTRSTGSCRC